METLDCFIPVYNEEAVLEHSVLALLQFCEDNLAGPFRIVVVDNGSDDATRAIAARLARDLSPVAALHFDETGRGRALRRAFLTSEATYLGYMDADLSTHLRALPEALIRLRWGADMVIGSRLVRGAHIRRQLKREVLSRTFNALVRRLFDSPLHDHQCGFKFMTHDACRALVPSTRDDKWFFDTELLVLGLRRGQRIEEIPVDWIEDLGSTVHIARTVVDDLIGMHRLRRRLAGGSGDSATRSVTDEEPGSR